MANITRTIADTAGFIPQAWAQMALDVLRSNIVLARIVTRDTDFEPGWKGKTLNIPYPGTFSAADKAADTPASLSTPSGGTSVAVTLDKHKYVDFLIEDFARAQASSELMLRWVEPAAIALADAVEDSLFALYSGLSQSVGTSGTDLAPAVIRSARKTLNDGKVPTSNRHLIVSSKDEIALLGESTLATYFAQARPEAVAEGSMGNLYGFQVWMSQRVPSVAGTPVSTKCLALHKEAFILATRPFQPIDSGAGAQAFTSVDPASGLAIRVIHEYSVADRGHRIGFDILYGVAELRDVAGVVVLT